MPNKIDFEQKVIQDTRNYISIYLFKSDFSNLGTFTLTRINFKDKTNYYFRENKYIKIKTKHTLMNV